MLSTDKEHIAYLVELLVANNVSQVVVSPGSRNAPIVTAFCAHPSIQTFTIHDERVAAFTALGLAESSGKAVVLTCTSGTAALNYSPAIAEAYYRQIPLIVLTADRPTHLIDQGDGQTIRQNNLFNNFIKFQACLPNEDDFELKDKSTSIYLEMIKNVNAIPKGPVHLNVPLSEPLYGRKAFQFDDIAEVQHHFTENDEVLSFVIEQWKQAKKKLIIVGQHEPHPALLAELRKIGEQADTAVLVENTSNLSHFPKFVHCIDRTLAAITPDEIANFSPDLLVTFGGAIVSKRIKAFLRNTEIEHIYRVGHYTIEENTFLGEPQHLRISPSRFLMKLNEEDFLAESNYGALWKQRDFMAQDVHDNFIAQAPFSDLKVFNAVLDALPESTHLHMANSSVVRYCQLFNPVSSFTYYGNRGVSGIDGSASTAAGIAMNKKDELHVLITGDTSFFYDSNAFWNEYLTDNLRVIVVNNGGGGIFQIIDGPKSSEFATQFFAPFKASVKGICEAFECEYSSVNNLQELATSFETFFAIDNFKRPKVMGVHTHQVENATILADYFASITQSF